MISRCGIPVGVLGWRESVNEKQKKRNSLWKEESKTRVDFFLKVPRRCSRSERESYRVLSYRLIKSSGRGIRGLHALGVIMRGGSSARGWRWLLFLRLCHSHLHVCWRWVVPP